MKNWFKKYLNTLLISFIVLFIIIGVVFTYMYKNGSSLRLIRYKDESSLDYNVYLKSNKYYNEKYLGKDYTYISSIVDYVDANLKYNIKLDNKYNYDYSYRIDGILYVKDRDDDGKVIFSKTYNLVDEVSGVNNKNLYIDENVKVKYDTNNDYIKKFINKYNVRGYAYYDIKLYVTINGVEKVSSLSIPLNVPSFEIGESITNNVGKMVTLDEETVAPSISYLIVAIIFYVLAVLLVALMIIKTVSVTDPHDRYRRRINRIKNNYDSYIQQVDDVGGLTFDKKVKIKDKGPFSDAVIINAYNVTDLLDIKEIVNQPILMVDNEVDDFTAFIILDVENRIIYAYTLIRKDKVEK